MEFKEGDIVRDKIIGFNGGIDLVYENIEELLNDGMLEIPENIKDFFEREELNNDTFYTIHYTDTKGVPKKAVSCKRRLELVERVDLSWFV